MSTHCLVCMCQSCQERHNSHKTWMELPLTHTRRSRVRSASIVSLDPTGPVYLAPQLTQDCPSCATGEEPPFLPTRNRNSSGVTCAQTLSRKKYTANPEQGRDFQTRWYAQHKLWRACYLHVREWSRPKALSYAALKGLQAVHDCLSPNPSFTGKHTRQCNLLWMQEVKDIYYLRVSDRSKSL